MAAVPGLFRRAPRVVSKCLCHTRELVQKGNARYVQARTLDVTLKRRHVRSSQRLDHLKIRLMFTQ